MKVGDYVRTKWGEIAKIDECLGIDDGYKNMYHYETDRMVTKFNNFILYEEDIFKSSSNIIDLIEVGDYVNGNKIIKISNDHCGRTVLVWGFDNGDFQCAFAIYEEDIKSIVTKEQFESMEYKIGE